MMDSRLPSLFPLLLLLGTLTISAKGDEVIVTFVMVQKINEGQLFQIVGNNTALGNWTAGQVENMTWTPGNAWASSVVLSKGVAYSYKAVVVLTSNQNKGWCWSSNRDLLVPNSYSKSHYVESVFWDESCGYDCHEILACPIKSRLSKSGDVPLRISTLEA